MILCRRPELSLHNDVFPGGLSCIPRCAASVALAQVIAHCMLPPAAEVFSSGQRLQFFSIFLAEGLCVWCALRPTPRSELRVLFAWVLAHGWRVCEQLPLRATFGPTLGGNSCDRHFCKAEAVQPLKTRPCVVSRAVIDLIARGSNE